jgi:hypothetical protein
MPGITSRANLAMPPNYQTTRASSITGIVSPSLAIRKSFICQSEVVPAPPSSLIPHRSPLIHYPPPTLPPATPSFGYSSVRDRVRTRKTRIATIFDTTHCLHMTYAPAEQLGRDKLSITVYGHTWTAKSQITFSKRFTFMNILCVNFACHTVGL